MKNDFILVEKLFSRYLDNFDSIYNNIISQICKFEHCNGYFYEIFPFQYQRFGFKKGKILNNGIYNKNPYTYGFDDNENIILLKRPTSIKDLYDVSFIIYCNDYDICINYDYDKELSSVECYFKDKQQKYTKNISKGRRGSQIEIYHYNEENILHKIEIQQFDENNQCHSTLYHEFIYEKNQLKSIIKYPSDRNYQTKIYP